MNCENVKLNLLFFSSFSHPNPCSRKQRLFCYFYVMCFFLILTIVATSNIFLLFFTCLHHHVPFFHMLLSHCCVAVLLRHVRIDENKRAFQKFFVLCIFQFLNAEKWNKSHSINTRKLKYVLSAF